MGHVGTWGSQSTPSRACARVDGAPSHQEKSDGLVSFRASRARPRCAASGNSCIAIASNIISCRLFPFLGILPVIPAVAEIPAGDLMCACTAHPAAPNLQPSAAMQSFSGSVSRPKVSEQHVKISMTPGCKDFGVQGFTDTVVKSTRSGWCRGLVRDKRGAGHDLEARVLDRYAGPSTASSSATHPNLDLSVLEVYGCCCVWRLFSRTTCMFLLSVRNC